MALKAVLESLDDVQAEIHDQYKETKVADKTFFILQVDGINDHPAVKNLKTAHEAVKTKRDEYKTQVDQFAERLEGLPEDFSAQMFKDLQAQAEGKGGKVTPEQIEQIRQQERAKLDKETKPLKDRNQVLETELRRTKIDDGLVKALVDAGVSREFLGAAKSYLKEQGTIELVEENGRFSVRVETQLGPQTLNDYVKEWMGSDEGKPFAGKVTGGDAGGSNGRSTEANPFKVKDGQKPNFTDIDAAIRADKGKALSQARAAGWGEPQLREVGLA